jgi:hypothetical protein
VFAKSAGYSADFIIVGEHLDLPLSSELGRSEFCFDQHSVGFLADTPSGIVFLAREPEHPFGEVKLHSGPKTARLYDCEICQS